MTLGYKQKFADGSPTFFREKILKGTLEHLNLPFPIEKAETPTLFLFLLTSHRVYRELKPKLTSIRRDPHDRWPPSTGLIHHVYGNRTPERDCFLVSPCVSVQRIMILNTAKVGTDDKGNDKVVGRKQTIVVDGRVMSDEQKEQIAINDGFDNLEHFFTWFQGTFAGKIIHFTKLRY